MAFGVDYVVGPSPVQLKAAGVSFVCRYLSEVNQLTQVKLLVPAEAKALSQAGIAIVSNFEWYANRSLEGFAAGVADAKIAASQHADCGGSSTRPIYFSVDADVDGSQVLNYFKGVASVIGLARTGAYGSYRVLKYLFDAGTITWGWQTYAWSHGAWESRAHIQQYENGMSLAGHSVDYDRSIKSDFGQWLVGEHSMTVAPAPPHGWRDDGHTLFSPPNETGAPEVPITGMFRDYILKAYPNWPSGNLVKRPAYHADVLEENNSQIGSGEQIIFRYSMLCIADAGPFAGKVTFEWLGNTLDAVRALLAEEKAQVASLATQIQQANAQLAQEQETIKTLQAEIATHPDMAVLANRLSAIGMNAKQASDLLAQVQMLAAQPLS